MVFIIDNQKLSIIGATDPQSAFMFDEMEKTLQKYKLELQQRKLSQPKTPPRKGMIEFAAFNGKKKKPEPRLKGFGG